MTEPTKNAPFNLSWRAVKDAAPWIAFLIVAIAIGEFYPAAGKIFAGLILFVAIMGSLSAVEDEIADVRDQLEQMNDKLDRVRMQVTARNVDDGKWPLSPHTDSESDI